MQKTSRWSAQRSRYLATVISSFIPFIWKAPSPTNATTGRSGWANFAATAYGTPGPIVARLPESEASIPLRTRSWRAHQFVEEPESAVRMQPSGSCFDSSWTTLCGLIGSPSIIARSSTSRHHSSTLFSTCSRHERSSLRRSSGMRPWSASFASPTRLTSMG